MRSTTFVAAFLVFVAAAPSAGAAPLERGTVELAPAVSFSHASYSASGGGGSVSLTTFAGSAGLGYCISDRAEILGNLIVTDISGDFGSGSSVGLSGGVGFNFPSGSNVVPFVQAQLGILTNSGGGDTSLLLPTLEGGIRLLVGSSASVNIGVGFQHQTNALGVSDVSANVILLQLGVSIFPKAGS
jgi:hypothetical protein